MPKITDKDYEEFMKLKKQKQERMDAIKRYNELVPSDLPNLRPKITTRKLATIFVRTMNRLMREEEVFYEKEYGLKIEVKEITKSWRDLKTYLTEICLVRKGSKWEVKQQFREILRQYGIYLRIDRRSGIVTIIKKSPKEIYK